MPAASGTRVVWVDQRSGNWDIRLYDLTAQSERKLSDAPITGTSLVDAAGRGTPASSSRRRHVLPGASCSYRSGASGEVRHAL